VTSGDQDEASHLQGRHRAAAIYGSVITAAVIAAGGNTLSTAELEVTVLVTLLVYWVAEQYAALLGEHTQEGRLPSSEQARASFAASWPMVSASFVPLISLLIARGIGVSTLDAAQIGLIVAVALLVVHGHAAGKAAGLKGVRLAAVTVTAGLLGVAMIVLKALLQRHHHLY
jgi:hypothetical protein